MKKTTKSKSASKPVAEMTSPNRSKESMCVCASCPSDHCASWGLMILRLAVGGAFMWHGITKFMGFEGTQGFFTSLFGGAGPFLAGLVAGVEVLGGLLLIIGIWTRWASYLLAIVLVVAIVWAKKFAWPQIELDTVLLASLLALAWNGPGKWSLHEQCDCCKH